MCHSNTAVVVVTRTIFLHTRNVSFTVKIPAGSPYESGIEDKSSTVSKGEKNLTTAAREFVKLF